MNDNLIEGQFIYKIQQMTMTINALDIHLATDSERQKWDDYVLSHMRGLAY